VSAVNTDRAVETLLRAARTEHDFAGWLADVLAKVAGQLGSSDALTEGRPGSWEASLVDQLVKGTVGHDDKYLPKPRTKLTDAKVREIRDIWADGFGGVTQRELAAEFGVSASTISDITSGKTWRRLS
jgi:Helix-turn-helix